MGELRLEGLFHVSDTRDGGDYIVRKLVELELLARFSEYIRKSCSILLMDRKYFGFLVQMINGIHLHATGGYAESKVLDNL